MKRRSLLALPAAILPSIAPLRVHATGNSSLPRPLTVSAFGGVFQEAFTSYVANKFTEETGIPVSVVSQSLDDTWVFGIANAGRNGLAPVDLTILTRSQIMRLERIGGMLQPFSRARLNNLTWLQDRYITEGDSGITGIGTMAWFINLVTNTSATAGQPVDSWREVFESPEYNNRIGLQGFIMAVCSRHWQMSISTVIHRWTLTKGFRKFLRCCARLNLESNSGGPAKAKWSRA